MRAPHGVLTGRRATRLCEAVPAPLAEGVGPGHREVAFIELVLGSKRAHAPIEPHRAVADIALITSDTVLGREKSAAGPENLRVCDRALVLRQRNWKSMHEDRAGKNQTRIGCALVDDEFGASGLVVARGRNHVLTD